MYAITLERGQGSRCTLSWIDRRVGEINAKKTGFGKLLTAKLLLFYSVQSTTRPWTTYCRCLCSYTATTSTSEQETRTTEVSWRRMDASSSSQSTTGSAFSVCLVCSSIHGVSNKLYWRHRTSLQIRHLARRVLFVERRHPSVTANALASFFSLSFSCKIK